MARWSLQDFLKISHIGGVLSMSDMFKVTPKHFNQI